MATIKQSLKAAKAAIERNEPELVLEYAEDVLELDTNNFFAYIFQGKSYQLLNDLDKAKVSFAKATTIEPENSLGWKGAIQVAKATKDHPTFLAATTALCNIETAADRSVANLLVDLTNYLEANDYKQNVELHELYLRSILPGTPLGDILGSNLGTSDQKITSLIDLVIKKYDQLNARNLAKARVKFGKNITIDQNLSLFNMTYTIYKDCDLDSLFNLLLNTSNEDTIRSTYQEKYLKYKYEMLQVSPNKSSLITELKSMIDDMVLLKAKSVFAWNLYFDWSDFENLGAVNIDEIIFYLNNFPSEGLSQILYAYILSDSSQFDKDKIINELKNSSKFKDQKIDENDKDLEEMERELAKATLTDSKNDKIEHLSSIEISTLMLEGYLKARKSIFANRILCNYHIHLQEYGEASTKCHDSIKILAQVQRNFGLDLVNTKEDLLCALAITYTYYEAPKNFPRALELYDRILEKNKDNVRAKVGKGLILIEKNDLENAKILLGEVTKDYPDNTEALKEYSWCLIKLGEHESGRTGLLNVLTDTKGVNLRSSDLRATIHWRCARSYILEDNSNPDFIKQAYTHLIKSLKESPNHAPSFTFLGILYSDYYHDNERALKCFYKAFELDGNEVTAARYLVKELADKNEWEVAEILCDKMISLESSRRILLNNTDKVDNAWPYRVLGCSSMNKQDDAKAVEWFQTALRMVPGDVQCWAGLGEAYYNCGRLDAASKVYRHVLTLKSEDWTTIYMLGKILTEMSEFEEGLKDLNIALELQPHEECIITAIYEAYMGLTISLIDQGYIGRALASNADALNYILKGQAVNRQSPTLWKSLGECLGVYLTIQSSMESIPIDVISTIFSAVDFSESSDHFEAIKGDSSDISLPNSLKLFDDGNQVVSILNLIVLSARAGILYLPNKISKYVRSIAFYNLGLAYLELTFREESETTSKLAIKYLKKAIQLEDNNASFWVALGNAYISTNPQISQHCFIKATTLEARDASIWTNLAALYLRYGDAQLAQEAFLRAQSVAPQQSQPWLGNALSSEALGDKELASRLFTHAYIVSNGRSPLAQLLYGLSIVNKHHDGSDPRDTEAAQEFSAASFALQKYLQYYPKDEQGLKIGLSISERCKNFVYAREIAIRLCELYEREYELTESEVIVEKFADAKSQLSRIHLALEEYDLALESAQFALDLTETNESVILSSRVVIGLALFFNNKFDESVDMLTQILEKKSDSSTIVVLIAQVLNSYGTEDAKQEALNQLFAYISDHGSSLLVVLVLGAISVVDNLEEYFDAIKDELEGLNLESIINDSFKIVPQLLFEINKRLRHNDPIWQRQAVLFPADYHIWDKLSNSMTMAIAELKESKVNAGQLSDAYLNSGELRNIQRSLFLNPGNESAIEKLSTLSTL